MSGAGGGGADAPGADGGALGAGAEDRGGGGAAVERLFGTDGIRARFGEPPLDRATVTALGRELAAMLREKAQAPAPEAAKAPAQAAPRPAMPASTPVVILGGDTRESTPVLCRWLAEGLAAGGAAVRYAGVIPTPGVSYLTARLGAAAGVVVSASHNPYPDNGIKLLDGKGCKWSDAAELEMERRLRAAGGGAAVVPARAAMAAAPAVQEVPTVQEVPPMRAAPAAPMVRGGQALPAEGDAGSPAVETALHDLYLRHLADSAAAELAVAGATEGLPQTPAPGAPGMEDRPAPPSWPLAGLRVVLDAGNGAASGYAGELFASLGAEVTLLGASPNGRNVNLACGSTAPERMAAAVAAAGAHLGAAFDGDADRCILADERGEVRDGDAILYLWATSLQRAGHLEPPAIVATSMSNLGLERALARQGISVVRCDVGDRAVVEEMARQGIRLGGEQSGHIVCRDLAATGDGLLTAVQMAANVQRAGRPLSELLSGFRRYPQTLINVRVARKPDLATLPRVAATARAIEDELGVEGRLVLRYSGTEPLARVMIEGPDQTTIDTLAGRLAAALNEEIGAASP